MGLREALWGWRYRVAAKEGVEVFRVLPNATLEAILATNPRGKEELLQVKGFKEGKWNRYGKDILAILAAEQGDIESASRDLSGDDPDDTPKKTGKEKDFFSVSEFLDGMNLELSGMAARVRGEVSSVDERERVVYFTLKDSADESILNCLMFRSQYVFSGVKLAIGDEIVVEGVPEIYKPSGRLSMKVGMIELFGEGALKKAYDELYRKLEREGLFAPERKRALPIFPSRIALVTSREGAAIGDFSMNLGPLGIRVDLYPTSVEGKKAVTEILEAITFFAKRADEYDLLVIIRGGGSLESLQAFNHESLVQAIANFPFPVLAGIGHEKDITLAALASDEMVSTPTATARRIREPFERAKQEISHRETLLFTYFSGLLEERRRILGKAEQEIAQVFPRVRTLFEKIEHRFRIGLEQYEFSLRRKKEWLSSCGLSWTSLLEQNISSLSDRLKMSGEKLREYDPKRALSLGYSIVRSGGRLIRSTTSVNIGDTLDISVRDGTIETEVRRMRHE